MSRERLVLFDVDGTLVTAHGLGSRLFAEVLTQECGRPITSSGVVFSGRTDPQIMHDILTRAGYTVREAERITARSLQAYAQRARQVTRPGAVTVLPGVLSALQTLHGLEGVYLGLLTGNLEETAFGKVRAAGLDHFFSFGAFGSDNRDRNELPPVAIRRAKAMYGIQIAPTDCVIVGDSPLDIACARSAGMLCVAVATGVHSYAELQAHRPDILLPSLVDPAPFITGARLAPEAVSYKQVIQ